jgi:hypothetical protein
MSSVEAPAVDSRPVRWLGYGLMVAGAVLPVVSVLARPDLTNEALTLAAIVVPAAMLALVVHTPAAFEVKARRSPARVINFLLVLPSASLMVAAFTTPLLVPQVGFLTAAAGAAIGLLIWLWAPRRSASANPVAVLGPVRRRLWRRSAGPGQSAFRPIRWPGLSSPGRSAPGDLRPGRPGLQSAAGRLGPVDRRAMGRRAQGGP